MIAGWFFSLILCILVYAPTLNVGFLPDDLLHIDYVAAALRGDWGDFLSNFTGNRVGPDLVSSYRPVVSLAIFVDALIGGVAGKLYHATNILLLFLCACFTGMVTMELSGLRGNRLGAAAAVWAACLFSVYPLHAESVSLIIGRVDLLCTLFYLASVWSYFRFRLLRERSYFRLSLFTCVLALLSNEIAVTLPAVIILAEFVLPLRVDEDLPESVRADRLVQRVSYVMSYLFVLGFFAGIRLLLSGTPAAVDVGATAAGGLDLFGKSNRDTLCRILLPLHEGLPVGSWIRPTLIAGYVGSLTALIARCLFRSLKPGTFLFLIGWIAVSMLPLFQTWHIGPDLVGGRFFFNSSAPFCILLALLALPAVDAIARRSVIPLSVVGCVALSAVLVSWTALSQVSVKPWLLAGSQMERLRGNAINELQSLKPDQSALFLNLPGDYARAGSSSRESYLKLLSRPPFTASDLSARIKTIESAGAGSPDFLWSQEIRAAISSSRSAKTLVWNPADGRFVPLVLSVEKGHLSTDAYRPERFSSASAQIKISDVGAWKKIDDNYSVVERGQDFLRVRPGKQSVSLLVPDASGLCPLWTDLWRLEMKTQATESIKDKIWLVWTVGGEIKQAPFLRRNETEWTCWSGRHRDWALSGPITSLQLLFEPGDYEVDVLKLVPSLSDDSSPASKVPASDDGAGEAAIK